MPVGGALHCLTALQAHFGFPVNLVRIAFQPWSFFPTSTRCSRHGKCAYLATHPQRSNANHPPRRARITGGAAGVGPGPEIMAAATQDGNKVISADGAHIGKISDIMLDVRSGHVAYAALSEGGFLGMGNTLRGAR